MKKLIVSCMFMLASIFANAEIPKKFNVYTSGAGSATRYCLELVNEYNKKYQSQAVLVIKPGAGGVLATLAMVNDTNFSFYCFAGNSEMFLNRVQYPTHNTEHDMLTPVNVILEAPYVFNTRISNPFDNLTELLDSGKQLTVGHHTTNQKIVAEKIFPTNTVFVNYRSAQDAISSIRDGSIDIYVDGGAFSAKNYESMIKSLGHIHGPSTTPGVNYTAKFKHKNIAKNWAGFMTSKNNNASDIEELSNRLAIVVKEDVLTNIIVSVNNLPLFLNLQESTKFLEIVKSNLNK